MKNARVDPLIQKYVTGHSLGREIMSHYISVDLHKDMLPYFEHIQPLLIAIAQRAQELGLSSEAKGAA